MEEIQLKAKKKKLNKVKQFSISRLNISFLVCMVQALQSCPVMISLFVEKRFVLYHCTIVLVVFPYVTLLIKKNYFCLKPLFRWLNVRSLFVRCHSSNSDFRSFVMQYSGLLTAVLHVAIFCTLGRQSYIYFVCLGMYANWLSSVFASQYLLMISQMLICP